MKKIYNAPEASLLCFRPVEDLAAIEFDALVNMELQDVDKTPVETSANDITIKL